ncbi:hypothetical protein GCM10027456_22150 [Kineosporia babensis]
MGGLLVLDAAEPTPSVATEASVVAVMLGLALAGTTVAVPRSLAGAAALRNVGRAVGSVELRRVVRAAPMRGTGLTPRSPEPGTLGPATVGPDAGPGSALQFGPRLAGHRAPMAGLI